MKLSCCLISYLTLCLFSAALAEEPAQQTDEAWEQLLHEAESSMELSLSLEEELQQLMAEPALSLWVSSLHVGIGYTDNYLRRRNAISSRLSLLESELIFVRQSSRHEFQVYVYGEGNVYHDPDESVSEGLAIGQLDYSFAVDADRSIGQKLQIYAADLLYDASLALEGIPQQERLRQIRPAWALTLEQAFAGKHQLRAEAGVRRSLYQVATNDAWRLSASLEWTMQLLPKLQIELGLQGWQDAYDKRGARWANGLTIGGEELSVNGYGLSLSGRWNTPINGLSLNASGSLSREIEKTGLYEANDQLRASARMRYKHRSLQLELAGQYLERSYRHRTVSFLDTTLQHQELWSVQARIDWAWSPAFSTSAQLHWEDFSTPVDADNFRQRRLQLVFQWSL